MAASVKRMVPVVILSMAFTIGTGGCATIFTGGRPDQKVSFKSIPEGASVIVDGEAKGLTPLKIPLARDLNHKVRLELSGYAPFEKDIKTGFNGWVIGNVVFGGIIGLVIDIISGSTDSLNPSSVSVNFEEQRAKLTSGSKTTTPLSAKPMQAPAKVKAPTPKPIPTPPAKPTRPSVID